MSQYVPDEQTLSQLAVLSEVSAIFSALGADYWLRGGWAIDFLLGEITRSHEDIDLVTWVDSRESLEQRLVEAAFDRTPRTDRQTDFRKGNVDIQIVYLTRSSKGDLVPNGLPEWVWRADSLSMKPFTLHGISALVLHPTQLLEEKEVYEQIGRTPRPKDLESKRILQRILAEG